MYLGIACIVTRRKVSRCRSGNCGRDIEQGEKAITVVRKGSKGRTYRWFHLECFLTWAEHLYERRRRYHAENPPTRSGRPMGSVIKDLFESNPELARERHKCIRDSARLRRYLLATDDKDRQDRLIKRISKLDGRIKEIIPRQVTSQGRRTHANAERLEELQRARELSPHEEGLRRMEEAGMTPEPISVEASPAGEPSTTDEDDPVARVIADMRLRQAERLAGKGVTVEDGVGQEDGGTVFRGYKEDGAG